MNIKKQTTHWTKRILDNNKRISNINERNSEECFVVWVGIWNNTDCQNTWICFTLSMLNVLKKVDADIIILHFRIINLCGWMWVVGSANCWPTGFLHQQVKSKYCYGIRYSLFKFNFVQLVFEQYNKDNMWWC